MRTKTLMAGALVAAALFLSGAVGPVRPASSDGPEPAPQPGVDTLLLPTQSGADAIDALEARVLARPDDAVAAATLGLTYLADARDAARPSSLVSAEEALRRSLRLQPHENLPAYVGMASLANARHDFSGSVGWSRRAIETNPYSAPAYGLLGDALFELGHVRRADSAYQEMVSRRPDVSSYVRASYALQHRGETRAAIAAMRLALRAAGPAGETAAWVRHQMGDIYAGLGNVARAERENRVGAAVAPGFVPPTVGIAEALIARGRLGPATSIMERAAEELPTLEYLTTLGDLYRATGRAAAARAQYAEAAAALGRYRAAGVRPDADFVVFYADHGLRPGAALREAFAIYRNRPTQKTADSLAWMLHARARAAQAWRYAREAVSAPRPGADALLHAGAIADSLDRDRIALELLSAALDVDPQLATLQPRPTQRLLKQVAR